MSSYIKEIFLHTNGHLRAHNGNGRSANYLNSCDERKSGTHHKKQNNYMPKGTLAIMIIHDPLSFTNGGFIKGSMFASVDWEKMRSARTITENTIFRQDGYIWRMVTLKNKGGNKTMKRVKIK